MTLRSKIVAIVTTVVLLYALLDHYVQRSAILPRFEELEREEALVDMHRVEGAIESEIAQIEKQCRSLASSDDTYAYIGGMSDESRELFEHSFLNKESRADDEIDLLFLCDPDGRVLWGAIQDWRTGKEITLRDFPAERLAPGHPYLVEVNAPRDHESNRQRGYVAGLVLTEAGPMLLASRPVVRSDGSGDVRGTLILGRLLNGALVDDIGKRISVDFELWPLDDPNIPALELERLSDVTASTSPRIFEGEGDFLDVCTTVSDMRRAPSLLARARVPREISARGEGAVKYSLVSTISAGALLLLVLLGALQRVIVGPIGQLTAHALYIGQTEDSTAKLPSAHGRNDEIGVLAREFDSMVQKLAQSRATVVDTARKAGMSEIANGILHNVGNVLNSVNVSAGIVSERVRGSKLGKLERLTELAEAHADDLGTFLTRDPKGAHFRPFLSELTRLMRADQDRMEGELAELNKGIEHIRALVTSQQAFAGKSGLREATNLEEALENALRLSEQATGPVQGLEIEREYEELPAVRLDRHKLMEILVNVIKNAREAVVEVAEPRRIRLKVWRDADSGEVLHIAVADSGPGIAAENLTRVFNHGFTTKARGHGFGLHSSANAAKEMDGKLSAVARGDLGGATFTIDLPFDSASAPVGARIAST